MSGVSGSSSSPDCLAAFLRADRGMSGEGRRESVGPRVGHSKPKRILSTSSYVLTYSLDDAEAIIRFLVEIGQSRYRMSIGLLAESLEDHKVKSPITFTLEKLKSALQSHKEKASKQLLDDLESKMLRMIGNSNLLTQEKKIISDSRFITRIIEEVRQETNFKKKLERALRLGDFFIAEWKGMISDTVKNRPKYEDISHFQETVRSLKKDEKASWEEMVSRAGVLYRDYDIELMRFFLGCTQESKISGLSLLYWEGIESDLKRVQDLVVRTSGILETREKIKALSTFRDFRNQLETLRVGQKIGNLAIACNRAGISDEEKELICGFSDFDSHPKGRNKTPFWEGKDAASLERALAALQKVVEFRNKPQIKAIPPSVEQKSVSAPIPPAREDTHKSKESTTDKVRFLNKYGEAFGLGNTKDLSEEKLRERLREKILESGEKEHFSRVFKDFLQDQQWSSNEKTYFSAFTKVFLTTDVGNLCDGRIDGLSKNFSSIKNIFGKKYIWKKPRS